MTPITHQAVLAVELCRELVATGFGPFYGTACGAEYPLQQALHEEAGLLTVAREDNAIGIAAGAALTGHHPVVLMQNHGLTASLTAIASLVVPYRIPLLMIVALQSPSPGHPAERMLVSKITRPVLEGLGVEVTELGPDSSSDGRLTATVEAVRDAGVPTALLVPASLVGSAA